jgi:ABC-type Fe3+/spermidine/putrescine transport system ATPase subunit
VGLELRNIRKQRGSFRLEIESLEAAAGETLVLAGDSGCGKTTVLNIIAGLVESDAGQVLLDGRPLDGVPPWKRRVSLVFQDLALFPHLDTAQNVAYSAFLRGLSKSGRERTAREFLEIVHLPGYERRRVSTLSGGERQRAAIARALAAKPDILLLDEPFSSLDAPLRRRLRSEFSALFRTLKIPCIFVTHDQEEAAVLGGRIAFMRGGSVIETGTPEKLFLSPETRAAADFFGAGTVLPCGILIPHDAVLFSEAENTVPLQARVEAAFFEGSRIAVDLSAVIPGKAKTVTPRAYLPPRAALPQKNSVITVWIAANLLRRVR